MPTEIVVLLTAVVVSAIWTGGLVIVAAARWVREDRRVAAINAAIDRNFGPPRPVPTGRHRTNNGDGS